VVSRAGAGVGLFALHTSIILQRINGSRVTLDSRFDTTPVEAEGCLHEKKISGMGLRKYNAYIRWEECTIIIP
jgi:hypothetical protein